MAFKIYKKNNYIIVEDTIAEKQYQGLAKNVFVYKDTITETTYDFEGLTYNGLKGIAFNDLRDETNTPFINEQAFIDFYTLNTGNFSGGGSSSLTTDEENAIQGANSPSATNVFATMDDVGGGGTDKENIVSGIVASGTNTYTSTYSPTLSAYTDGLKVIVRFTNANTSTATLNLNSLGAKAIVKGTSTALVSGDIPAGTTLLLAYDGTNFVIVGSQLVNQFFDWSPTYGGFSTPPSGGANRYSIQDKLCNFYIAPTVNGTSNTNALTVTLPFNAKNIQVIPVSFCIDNNVLTVGGYGLTTAGSNVLTITKQSTTAFATSGQKRAVLQGWYEIQ